MKKIIHTSTADGQFSLFIRRRDPICKRCGVRGSTQCSHYWERMHSATRFDPRNADGVCALCHPIWEGRRGGYMEYKMEQLGEREYQELARLHTSILKRESAIKKWMEIRDLLTTEPEINYVYN